MSKRINYNGEPKGKRVKVAYRAKPKVDYVQLQKNSGEKKGVDQVLTLSPVIATTSTNGSAFTLNLVRPGSASYNRVGRKIFLKSLRLTGQAEYLNGFAPTTGNITGGLLRMVVVWDKQPSGALPAFDEIFGVTLQDGTEQSQVLAPPRYDNMGRFQVLRDCHIQGLPQLTPGTGGSVNEITYYYPFDEFIKLGNRTTVFSGQSSPSTIADISSGGLYVYFRATTGSTMYISSFSNARLRYSD